MAACRKLLKDNPDWGTADRSHDLNHFFARLIFCFFAEGTNIFSGKSLFTTTVEQMSERDASNTHEVIGELFRAMHTRTASRVAAKLPRWSDAFPYVNAMDVRELDIDLIDRINPFGEAYAILAKTMSEASLKQIAAAIAAKRVNLTMEEARELAKRALKFKLERGRLPSIKAADAWEKRMAEGVAYLARMKAEAARG
jgi:hypothetical protein